MEAALRVADALKSFRVRSVHERKNLASDAEELYSGNSLEHPQNSCRVL
jgi:hypothetical protein